jgi:hypothetical protein
MSVDLYLRMPGLSGLEAIEGHYQQVASVEQSVEMNLT